MSVNTQNISSMSQPAQDDYFGFSSEKRYIFPDGVTWISFQTMNEGMKKRYQKMTQSDLILDRKSDDARLKVDQAEARQQLIILSATNWNLTRNGQPIPFQQRALMDFLELANPKLIEDVEACIRRENPWMNEEIPSTEIEKEIANLQEMLNAALERERGESSSSSK